MDNSLSQGAENAVRNEIITKRQKVLVDQMRMSVGELMSLYESEELNLSPDYQRLFRWCDEQQSDFIESILLGYPIPPIFVYQNNSGKWEVVDGVQRLSTIYRFTGILNKDKDNDNTDDKSKKPLVLSTGRVLKNIDGVSWENKEDATRSLDGSTKLDFRRSALNIIVILDKNVEENTTYEVFRRLNTGGSKLSDQEIRNVLILMTNKTAFNKMDDYCNNNEIYSNLLSLSQKKEVLGFKMEVLSRYLILKHFDDINLKDLYKDYKSNMEIFIDHSIQKILKSKDIDISNDIVIFDKLINFLSTYIDYDYNFRVFSCIDSKFKGGFNWLVFETLIWGLLVDSNLEELISNYKSETINAIKSIITTKEFYAKHNVTVMKSTERMMRARDYAKEVFSFGHR